jgi:hypothetical protein
LINFKKYTQSTLSLFLAITIYQNCNVRMVICDYRPVESSTICLEFIKGFLEFFIYQTVLYPRLNEHLYLSFEMNKYLM